MSEYSGPSEAAVHSDTEVDREVTSDVVDVDVDDNADAADDADVDVESGEEDEVFVLEEAPNPDSVLPVWEPTGHPDVDAALEKLHEISGSDVAEHAAVFEQVEASLRATLDGLTAEDEPA